MTDIHSSMHDGYLELVDTIMTYLDGLSEDVVAQETLTHNHKKLSTNGKTSSYTVVDESYHYIFHSALDEAEADKVPSCFYRGQSILMRKWRLCTAPQCCHSDVSTLAQSSGQHLMQ